MNEQAARRAVFVALYVTHVGRYGADSGVCSEQATLIEGEREGCHSCDMVHRLVEGIRSQSGTVESCPVCLVALHHG